MRLFLDAHISSRVIAHELRRDGHDVFAADEYEQLKKADDDVVLDMAAEEQRIFVTFDITDFRISLAHGQANVVAAAVASSSRA